LRTGRVDERVASPAWRRAASPSLAGCATLHEPCMQFKQVAASDSMGLAARNPHRTWLPRAGRDRLPLHALPEPFAAAHSALAPRQVASRETTVSARAPRCRKRPASHRKGFRFLILGARENLAPCQSTKGITGACFPPPAQSLGVDLDVVLEEKKMRSVQVQ
jgi:hypothetical protein